ncbi:MAG TPA: hypothetical protein ENN42_01290 [Thioalkalivibrio sp.]|nr:hypothetical protein [Thioalkalivibrio sp.]
MLTLLALSARAEPVAPWGVSKSVDYPYAAQRVVFDVTTASAEEFNDVLGRVSELNRLYGANPFEMSIVVLIHGNAIPFFTLGKLDGYGPLMARAESLAAAGPIEFRMCQLAARVRYDLLPRDIHGFVTMVPNGDAELIRLQREEGYAYMR